MTILAEFLHAPEWQRDAACREHDRTLFFPGKGDSTIRAQQICAGCLVRAECLEFALTNGEKWGIWGGTTGRQRRRLRVHGAHQPDPNFLLSSGAPGAEGGDCGARSL